MSSKQQEREALQKIREIVSGLGDDSYLAMAFDGCFEIAESNIDNDFACSLKQQVESAEKSYSESRKEISEWAAKLAASQDEVKTLTGRIGCLESEVKQKGEAVCVEHQRYLEELYKREAAEEQIQKLEGEVHWEKLTVMELKAKLYDYMVKEDEQK